MSAEPLSSEVIYAYILDYIDQHGYAPTIRNIAQACRLGTTTVFYNLNKLEAQGWIAREERTARSMRPLRQVPGLNAKKLEQN